MLNKPKKIFLILLLAIIVTGGYITYANITSNQVHYHAHVNGVSVTTNGGNDELLIGQTQTRLYTVSYNPNAGPFTASFGILVQNTTAGATTLNLPSLNISVNGTSLIGRAMPDPTSIVYITSPATVTAGETLSVAIQWGTNAATLSPDSTYQVTVQVIDGE